MRIPIWIIAAFSVAIPVAAMAAEGNPAAGKARADAAGCFACHGVDGVATADGLATDKNDPNLAAQPDLYLQFQLVFFRKGVRKNEVMNAMAEQLSDDDLRNVSAYFASLPPPNAPAPPDTAPQDTELGSKVAQANYGYVTRPWSSSTTSASSCGTERPCAVKRRRRLGCCALRGQLSKALAL